MAIINIIKDLKGDSNISTNEVYKNTKWESIIKMIQDIKVETETWKKKNKHKTGNETFRKSNKFLTNSLYGKEKTLFEFGDQIEEIITSVKESFKTKKTGTKYLGYLRQQEKNKSMNIGLKREKGQKAENTLSTKL